MATQERRPTSELGEQAIALAEQLGRIAGTIEGTAETWLNSPALTEQLTRVRDGANQMLETLSRTSAETKTSGANRKKGAHGLKTPATRMADAAHAPGKRHRKPAPTLRGAKKSDERIPKMRTAEAVRRRRKSYA